MCPPINSYTVPRKVLAGNLHFIESLGVAGKTSSSCRVTSHACFNVRMRLCIHVLRFCSALRPKFEAPASCLPV